MSSKSKKRNRKKASVDARTDISTDQSGNKKTSTAKSVGKTDDSVLSVTTDPEAPVSSADKTSENECDVSEISAQETDSTITEMSKNDVETSGSESGNVRRSTSRRSRKFLLIPILILAVALLIIISGIIWMNITAKPLYTEIGEAPDFSQYSDSFLKRTFISVDDSPEFDCSEIADHELSLTYFRIIKISVPLYVRDTVAPEFEVQNIETALGIELDAEYFVSSFEDMTDVTFTFDGEAPDPDSVGKFDVTIIATDEGGNVSKRTASLTVNDSSYVIDIELGTDIDGIRSLITEKHPEFANADLSAVNIDSVGRSAVSSHSPGTYYIFILNISDTTPPEVKVRSFDLLLGEEVKTEEIIEEVADCSPTEIKFQKQPDFSKAGTQQLNITVTDAYNNATSVTSELRIHDVPESITFEAGTSFAVLKNMVFKEGKFNLLEFPKNFSMSSLHVGENKVKLQGHHNNIGITVKMKDTVAPVIKLKDVTVYVNAKVAAESFVVSCDDATDVTYSFEGNVSTSRQGEFPVTVLATDAGGNQTKSTATLKIIQDTEPPVIYGVKNHSIAVGESVALKNGVYATDNLDGIVSVNVDSSSLNTTVEGVYYVYYTAVDSSGNTTSLTATVNVSGIGEYTINALADQVLATIINPSMSQREKAYAIYKWCTANIKYSTRTSYLMGQYYKAAYSGFKTHAGNCYVYWAVSSSLMTRAGIENIQIHRNSDTNPHYWSLVKMNGSWYHFDTCPHFAGHPFECFLKTDAEVAAYSRDHVKDYYSFNKNNYPATP